MNFLQHERMNKMAGKIKRKEKKHYPIFQGYLTEDSKTETCSTQRDKTSFEIIDIETKKRIPCVYWYSAPPMKKGQLVIVEGTRKNDCFICFKIQKIDRPYIFG